MVLKYIGFMAIIYLLGVLKLINAEDDTPKLKFVMDQMTKELELGDVLQTDLTFDKQGGECKISGEVKQMIDLDNEWKVNIIVLRADEADGDFQKMMSLPEKGVCELMTSYYKMYFYKKLKNYCNAPEPDQCAVVKETYVVKDYPLDSSQFQKFLLPGFYRLIGTLSNEGEEKLKYIFEGHVEQEN